MTFVHQIDQVKEKISGFQWNRLKITLRVKNLRTDSFQKVISYIKELLVYTQVN